MMLLLSTPSHQAYVRGLMTSRPASDLPANRVDFLCPASRMRTIQPPRPVRAGEQWRPMLRKAWAFAHNAARSAKHTPPNQKPDRCRPGLVQSKSLRTWNPLSLQLPRDSLTPPPSKSFCERRADQFAAATAGNATGGALWWVASTSAACHSSLPPLKSRTCS